MGCTIVTGASSGIGRSLARRLAAGGEPVALLARRRDLLDSLAKEIGDTGGRTCAIRCDVTDSESVRAAVAEAEARFGPARRLVANAGGAEPTDGRHFEARIVADQLDLNVVGVARCIEAVLPGMLERGSGHLVATGSLAASRGLPGAGAYSAAKAALRNLMESLRIDLRGSGVDVTLIEPGFVRTRPHKKRKRTRPFAMDLETATERIHRAIEARKPVYAFPRSLVAVVRLGRALPAPVYDRLLAGRGPGPKRR